jgi:hypothetical protein
MFDNQPHSRQAPLMSTWLKDLKENDEVAAVRDARTSFERRRMGVVKRVLATQLVVQLEGEDGECRFSRRSGAELSRDSVRYDLVEPTAEDREAARDRAMCERLRRMKGWSTLTRGQLRAIEAVFEGLEVGTLPDLLERELGNAGERLGAPVELIYRSGHRTERFAVSYREGLQAAAGESFFEAASALAERPPTESGSETTGEESPGLRYARGVAEQVNASARKQPAYFGETPLPLHTLRAGEETRVMGARESALEGLALDLVTMLDGAGWPPHRESLLRRAYELLGRVPAIEE